MSQLRCTFVAALAATLLLSACAAPPLPARVASETLTSQPVSSSPVSQDDATKLEDACRDYSNTSAPPERMDFYWRFVKRFSPEATEGCLQIWSATNLAKPAKELLIPCEASGVGSGFYGELNTEELPMEMPGGAPPARPAIPYAKFRGQESFTCRFNLNSVLSDLIIEEPSIGITETREGYIYSYFSLAALVAPITEAPTGTLIHLAPQCPWTHDGSAMCRNSAWSVSSPVSTTVQYSSTFNGRPPFVSPAFTVAPNLPQAWWVGLRRQFDNLDQIDVIRLEHFHDQASLAEESQTIGQPNTFRHQTTINSRKYEFPPQKSEDEMRVAYWGGDVTIHIGGSPASPTSRFIGDVIQVTVDPGSGGMPDGAQ